jgi:hypothetical protein
LDISHLIEWCIARGFEVTKTKRGHYRIVVPNGGVVIMGGSHGRLDRHAALNARAELRRALRKANWPEDDMP